MQFFATEQELASCEEFSSARLWFVWDEWDDLEFGDNSTSPFRHQLGCAPTSVTGGAHHSLTCFDICPLPLPPALRRALFWCLKVGAGLTRGVPSGWNISGPNADHWLPLAQRQTAPQLQIYLHLYSQIFQRYILGKGSIEGGTPLPLNLSFVERYLLRGRGVPPKFTIFWNKLQLSINEQL